MHIERQVSSILKENKQDKDVCVCVVMGNKSSMPSFLVLTSLVLFLFILILWYAILRS